MTITELFDKFDELFEIGLQFEYDNSGRQVVCNEADVSGIFVCLDVTKKVVEKAVENGCNVILSHHPVLFNAVNVLDYANPTQNAVIQAVKNGISVYSAHTCCDVQKDGLNVFVAKKIGLMNPEFLSEGVIGEVGNFTLFEFAESVKTALDDDVRVCGENKQIRKVAFINGAGGRSEDFALEALKNGADAIVSSEFKHSVVVFARELGLGVIEPTHAGSEYPFVELATEKIKNAFPQIRICAGEREIVYNK